MTGLGLGGLQLVLGSLNPLIPLLCFRGTQGSLDCEGSR